MKLLPPIMTIRDYTTKRVTMNAPPTYTLTALLSALLLSNVASLWLHSKTLAPKAPGTILGMASLLADSDISHRLPLSSEWLINDRVEKVLAYERFRMGWFEEQDGDGIEFTIGITWN